MAYFLLNIKFRTTGCGYGYLKSIDNIEKGLVFQTYEEAEKYVKKHYDWDEDDSFSTANIQILKIKKETAKFIYDSVNK